MSGPPAVDESSVASPRKGKTLASRLRLRSGYRGSTANKAILSSTLVVGGLTAIVSIAGAVNQVFIADEFGVSDELDAFLVAFALITFCVSVVSASLIYAFLPAYVNVREQRGTAEARHLLAGVTARSLVAVVSVSVVLAAASQLIVWIVGSGFDSENLALTRDLFLILLPVLTFKALSAIWAGVLNADERFAVAAAAPLAMPLATILAVVFLAGRYSVQALAVGVLAGFVIEAVVLGATTWRRGLFVLPTWRDLRRQTEGVMRQYGAVAIGSVLMGSTVLVDNAMASRLGGGSVSALGYGNRLPFALSVLGAMALGTAVLPRFSMFVANGQISEFWSTLRFWVRAVLVVLVPVTLVLVVASELIVRLLYERGAFSPDDTQLVARIQSFYFLQVPFYVLAILASRVLSAIRRNELLAVMAVVNVILNIAGNLVFSHFLGVRGIALSTALVYAATATMGFLFVKSRRWGLSSVQPDEVEEAAGLQPGEQVT